MVVLSTRVRLARNISGCIYPSAADEKVREKVVAYFESVAEIEETASYAAYHSKARKSAHVPVIYTQRKYVRKPRNAKPGLVTVEREKSIMVVPTKPE